MLDEASRQRDFPSLADRCYLNTAAEGIPPLPVAAALQQYFVDKSLGMDGRIPHAAHWEALRAGASVLLGTSPDEIGLCSCSSEAFNLAATALRLQPGDEVVINDLDFPAGATPWLQESCPAVVRLWRHRDGALRIEDLIPLLGPKTRFVTTSLVSFFNGYLVPLEPMIQAVRRHSDALIGVDVTQSFGRIPWHPADVDLIVSSTHKWLLGSHGGGIVAVPKRSAERWTVPAGGWFHLVDPFGPSRFERAVSRPGAVGFGVGMPNYPAVYAVRAAIDYVLDVTVEAIDRATRPLMLRLLDELTRLPIDLLTPAEPDSIAGIVAFRHAESDRLHRELLAERIHVMSHAGRLRIAVHGYNTEADIDRLLMILRRSLGI